MTNKTVRKALHGALDFVPQLGEWQDPAYKKQQKWAEWDEALFAVHEPETADELLPESPFRQRLAYDELLANSSRFRL